MRRAGGWVLGIVAVLAMAAGTWLALRRVVARETVTVLFFDTGQRQPTSDAVLRGVRYALHESDGKAGSFRVDLKEGVILKSPDVHLVAYVLPSQDEADPQPPVIFSALSLKMPDTALNFRAAPGLMQQGRAAAAWILKSKSARPYLILEPSSIRSLEINLGFHTAARELGLRVVGQGDFSTLRSTLVEDILASKMDLIFYSGEDAPYSTTYRIFSELRERGFKGTLLTAEADPEVSMLVVPGQVVEGTYLISPFAPAPDEFAKGYRDFTGLGAGIHAYYGYFAMKSALEAIDRANSKDPALILQAARKLPYYDAEGETTVHSCALYVARGGRFQFVELLK